MVKAKAAKATVSAPNKHLHSRISYLYQAATYLCTLPSDQPGQTAPESKQTVSTEAVVPNNQDGHVVLPDKSSQDVEGHPCAADQRKKPQRDTLTINNLPLSRRLISHLRGVSLKSQIRLSPDIKRSICKRCDTLLIPSSTSSTRLENKSRGGKKPWADVLVIECKACGAEKRFPVGAKKQSRRPERMLGRSSDPSLTTDFKEESTDVKEKECPSDIIMEDG